MAVACLAVFGCPPPLNIISDFPLHENSLDVVGCVCALTRQPAARRANIDFERSERERIHFETATRVMNYEIQAQRAEVEANKDLALRDDVDGAIAPVVSSSPWSSRVFRKHQVLVFGHACA